MWNVEWARNCKERRDSPDAVDSLLDQPNDQAMPVMVVVESQVTGNSLAIGLGNEMSILNFVAGSGDPPYYTSLGDREQAGTIEFDFMGEQSEFSARNAIPMLAARQAMRYFLERETMSPDLDWECD